VKAFLKHLLSPWTWRMAWRDSRTHRGRLLLFSSSIVLGVAGLAATGSLGKNLERAVDEQAKTLLGADLAVSSREAFSSGEEQLLTSLGGRQAREISFSSMIYFPNGGGTRLAQLRAVSGPFPFYGRLETEPEEAADEFRLGQGALVEDNLLIQFGAKVGDKIRLGKLTLPVVGALKKVPGESAALAVVSPRVYLPMSDLAQTGLLNGGGLARYRVFFQFPAGTNVAEKVAAIQPRLDRFRLGVETVETRKRDLGEAIDNQYHFLNLCCLIPLLLSGIGVASAMHVHVKQKLGTVAVLRCLGGSVGQTFAIYMGQGIALGLSGALAGSALGVAVPAMLPGAMKDFIPFSFQYEIAWLAVGRAACVGFGMCLLFALLPLLEVRRVSPLAALRRAYENSKVPRDPLRWLVGGCLAAGVVVFALVQERNWRIGLGFCAGLAAAFAVLAGTAKALVFVVRKFLSPTLPFALRQGLANLHRPNNRTLLLLLSLGLGVFLIVTIQMLQHTLATELIVSGGTNQPNAILFDIQPGQKQAVAGLVRSMHLPVLDEAPIVTMRLGSIKGRDIESILADKQSRIPSWVLRREYRSTYTDHLRDAEKVVAGRWIGRVDNSTNAVPISVEKDIAWDLQVGLGDEIVFDVQGVPVAGRVASLREVNWRRVQPNFFVLFPLGVLESAPHMDVLVTRVASSAQSAQLQRSVVQAFPNISVIDLTLILQTLDTILDKVSLVIQFMALFTVLTGILVLAGALVSGHFQRVQDSVLLRTLGASRRQINRILAVEYLSLGVLAAATGILLALAADWALAAFVFHVHFVPMAAPLLCALVATPALTAGLGLLMSRGILNQPPLVTLRNEEG
jgi:putative ABC transport system permease protein